MPSKINYNKLIEGIKRVIARGDYPKFLKMMNKMKNYEYSFRNLFLIYSQNPNATILKGFAGWNKLRKGYKKTS